MQVLASYMFGVELDQKSAEYRYRALCEELSAWLASKGAKDILDGKGEFRSLTGDNVGKFSIEILDNSAGSLEEVKLVEEAHNGQIFITTTRVVAGVQGIEVWATLSVTGAEMFVAPNDISPRCPAVIRAIISRFSDWRFGGQPLPQGEVARLGSDSDIDLICDKITGDGRALPLIVVSGDQEEQVWPDLSVVLARDLVGLADVILIDADASWRMTENIGANLSCYLGAVKLYWPKRGVRRQKPSYDYWLPDEMRSFGQNDAGMRRFVSFIRAKIMGVAAQNVVGSKLIRDIHAAAAREKLAEFKAGIVEKEFDFLVNENEDLRQEVIRKDERISALEASLEFHKDRIEQLEDKCANAASDLRAEGNESTVPARGEVRYYKKIGNKNGVDIMRHVDDCGHREGAWQPAFRADQAEKGIEKFEGTSGWQSLKHCGTCTGGGRWRVRW